MKAYKIVSKEPIMGDSLVKIVMAPQHILEKLSRQHTNLKNVGNKIDESANAAIRNYSDDGTFDRKLIQNVNVDFISMEEIGNYGEKKTKHSENNVMHRESNNIQVISKLHKQPFKLISKHQLGNPIFLKGIKEVEQATHDDNVMDEVTDVNNPQSTDVKMVPTEIISDIDSSSIRVPTEIPMNDSINSKRVSGAEELLSNPTTSENLIQTSTRGDMRSEFSRENISTEINSSNLQTSFEELENLSGTSLESSTESNVPIVVLKILKNRTVLVEETEPQIPDMLSMDTNLVPQSLPPPALPKIITRPSTTTMAPIIVETKPSKFPKKANLVDAYSKYKNTPKLEDVSIDSFESMELTQEVSLLDMETTQPPPPPENIMKSNTKRAVGDEGTFSNIVRPSPIRQKNIGDLLNNETDAERTERLNKSLKRLMHFVTIVGQVDSYLTKRFRSGLKNVARIFDSIEDTRRRRSNL